MSQPAKLRYQKITGELSKGYLETQILRCRDSLAVIDFSQLKQDRKAARVAIDDYIFLHFTTESANH
jgi:hypothetical protein